MRLVFLGAPGVGKGTQAKKVCEKFLIPHISTGDILRNEIKEKTELGKKVLEYVRAGKLVPDKVILELIKNRIKKDDAKSGFIMDGFPRTLEQAVGFLDTLKILGLKLDKVINITVDESEIIRRLSNRRVCSNCGAVYSFKDNQISDNIKCSKCGGKLIKREDDKIDVIKNRLKEYKNKTKPLINYYDDMGILVNIDGMGSQEEISERVLGSI